MMLRVLRDRFVRLVKGEDGAALVVTLAVFFFIYLVCMGVYAVGTNVRERIHLQNACDAAAYSAAVVQADTLSRIATINRAMSWTYVQMTRRQMDYIVNRWLDRTVSEYKNDMIIARSSGSPGRDGHDYWDIQPDGEILGLRYDRRHRSPGRNDRARLNDSKTKNVRIDRMEQANAAFLRTKTTGASFYAPGLTGDGLSRLRAQIKVDKNAISGMNAAEEKLSADMATHIEDAVREVLRANLGETDDRAIYKLVLPKPCLKVPDATADEEGRFLLWSDPKGHVGGASDVFKAGHDTWFPLDENGGEGFLRRYVQTESALKAAWHWQSVTWTCPPCVWVVSGGKSTTVRGRDVSDVYFYGATARPLILESGYFGADGTISIGLAKKTENPFARFLGSVTSGGIYSAFNPFSAWTVALASAKAGYAHTIPDDGGRKYWISYKRHWKETSEPLNLSQSNWDAVFVPVRMAGVNADGREWPRPGSNNRKPQWHSEKVSDHIQTWMAGSWKYVSSDNASSENPSAAYAGGTVDLASDQDKMDRESDLFWTEWDGDLSHVANDASHPVRAKWQIGSPGMRVDWGLLSERIFH